MRHVFLRQVIAVLLGGAVLTGGAAVNAASDPLQTWIAANAVPVRTTDAADEDFSDLEPLAKAIDTAQVVQLGEPGHGAGSSFAAKVRLIKFLHQRMGFDVLVWESGMYDVHLAQLGMRGSDAAVAAARRGIFQLWSDAEEVTPLFNYVKASQATTHPLTMAGFDMQVTADGTMERFASDLRDFIRVLADPELNGRMSVLAEQAIAARARLFSSKFASVADLTTLDQAAGQILAAMHEQRGAFLRAHDERDVAWMEHWIENMRVDVRNRFQARHSSGPGVEMENRRDARNFENLRWLIRNAYPGRKFIIWAHNVHVMKADYASDFRTIHVAPEANDMKPTGALLSATLGDRVYTIGMTAYQGSDAIIGGPATAIAPAVAGSLESRLHALGHPFVFLDLRAASPSLPIRRPLSARAPKYDTVSVPDIGKVYDGLFYIDQMRPATKLP
jgi:erythromycin esterase